MYNLLVNNYTRTRCIYFEFLILCGCFTGGINTIGCNASGIGSLGVHLYGESKISLVGKPDVVGLVGVVKSNRFLIALSGLDAIKSINIIHKNAGLGLTIVSSFKSRNLNWRANFTHANSFCFHYFIN